MSERKVPKIRFPGFTEEWDKEFISSMIELSDEKVTSDSELPVLTSSKTDGIQYQVDHFGRAQEHDVDGYNVLRRGYCTYRNRSDGTDFTFNINNLCDEGIISKFYPVFNTKDGNDLYFLTLLLNNEPKTIKTIAYTAKGTGQKVLSITDLKNMEIIVPELSEQEKIGSFFRLIDDQISSKQNELDKWKELKKGMLQKMFPKEGESVPEIRFPGFTDPWEQRRIIDVCDYVDYRGKTPTKTNEGIFLITAKNVKDGYIDYETSKEFIPEDEYEEVMHRGKPRIGDVLFTTEAPCGNVAQVNREDIALAQRIIKYRGHDGVIDNTYLKHYLLSPSFQAVLGAKSTGGTVQGIKGSELHQQVIICPKYEEQKKIGAFIDDIDNLITLHQRECEKWQTLKKSPAAADVCINRNWLKNELPIL